MLAFSKNSDNLHSTTASSITVNNNTHYFNGQFQDQIGNPTPEIVKHPDFAAAWYDGGSGGDNRKVESSSQISTTNILNTQVRPSDALPVAQPTMSK